MKKVLSIIISVMIIISSAIFVLANDYIKGDVNSDKAVNSNDALIMIKHIVNNTTSSLPKNVADVNNDGKINTTDVLEILKISVSGTPTKTLRPTTTTTKKTTTTTKKATTTTTKKTTTTTKKTTTTTKKVTTTTTKKTTTTAKPTTTTKKNTTTTKKPTTTTKVITTTKPTTKVTTTTAASILASSVSTISTIKAPSNVRLNKNYVPTTYKKKITGVASAYSGGGLTATGKYAQPGYVAVNPNQIPYHTKMWIVSNDGKYIYGYSSAEDTGGFIYWTGSSATLCDLYFPTNSQCNNFGRRSVTIYIL